MIARSEGRPIAADVFAHCGTKAIYKYGASDEAYQALRGSNLVMWGAIQWYARAGFEELDFGRTASHSEGLRRFKLNWGTTEQEIRYCRYEFQKQKYVAGKPEAERWSNRVVRGLPIGAARLAGRLLYRHVG
jgi:lipid II:glycine glycyltransferase (peptidoglycan interpeptide bridge formation enzyme)